MLWDREESTQTIYVECNMKKISNPGSLSQEVLYVVYLAEAYPFIQQSLVFELHITYLACDPPNHLLFQVF